MEYISRESLIKMSFVVIFVAKIEYTTYQAGIEDVFNAQAGTTFLQDWFNI